MSTQTLNDLIDYLKVNPSYITLIVVLLLGCTVLSIVISAIAHVCDKHRLSDISSILFGVFAIAFAFTAIFGDWQQDKHSGDYTVTRKGSHLYVNSHTEYLESAKLEIAKQDKNFVYAKYKDKIYKIPQIQDK